MYDKNPDYINGWNDALRSLYQMIETQKKDSCFSMRPNTHAEKALLAKVEQLHNLVNNLMERYEIIVD